LSYQAGAIQTAAQQFAEAAAVFAAQDGASELSNDNEQKRNELYSMVYAGHRAI
jgi:hypothetical protein